MCSLQRASGREVGREGVPGHVHVALSVHGDRLSLLESAAAQVRGVTQHGIDDQRPGPVVVLYPKRHLAVVEQTVPSADRLPPAVERLVNHGRALHDFSGAHTEDQVPIAAQRDLVRTLESQTYRVGRAARPDHEVVLQLALIAVIDEVRAWIDVTAVHFGVARHVRDPIALLSAA